jgi:hypothetical protein
MAYTTYKTPHLRLQRFAIGLAQSASVVIVVIPTSYWAYWLDVRGSITGRICLFSPSQGPPTLLKRSVQPPNPPNHCVHRAQTISTGGGLLKLPRHETEVTLNALNRAEVTNGEATPPFCQMSNYSA